MDVKMPYDQSGLIRVVPNAVLQQQEEAERLQAEEERRKQTEALTTSLAGYLSKCWQAAEIAKRPIEERLLACLRQVDGKYDPAKLAEIKKFGGSEIFIMLTSVKVRAAKAWIRDVMLPPGERAWAAEPTPVPELSPEILQRVEADVNVKLVNEIYATGLVADEAQARAQIEAAAEQKRKEIEAAAKKRAQRMEDAMDDDLVQADYYQAIEELIDDLVTFPACFLKGPVIRRRKGLSWMPDNTVQVQDELRKEYDVVSPFDLYPSPGARTLQDGYLIERHRLTRKDLNDLIGVSGYSEEAIRTVLREYGQGGLRNWLAVDQDRAIAESRDYERDDPAVTIEALEYCGSAQGKMLLEWGMDKAEIPDPDLDYEINAWLIGRHVIRCIKNPSPLGDRNYYGACFERKAGSIWGKALPELMSDIQDICNAAARALVNNMAIASGPQVEVNVDRIQAGEDVTNLYPWKIWQTTNDTGERKYPAINFFQPNAMTGELLKLFDYFFNLSGEITGVWSYSYGGTDSKGGGAGTASGLSMLMNASSRVMKRVVSNVDFGIVVPSIKALHLWTMLWGDDPSVKGDIKIRARASDFLIMAEQLQMRRNEFLQVALNPNVIAVIGKEGLAEILRESVRALKMPVDNIVPSRDDILRGELTQLQAGLERISAVLGIPIETLVAAIGGGQGGSPVNGGPAQPGGGPAQMRQSEETNPAGGKMGGQDFATFTQQPRP